MVMDKKRLLLVFWLFSLILAFIPNVIAQESLDNILQDGVLPIYEANQKGIDFIIALVLLLGLVKFALVRSKWDEDQKGFKLVWIAVSVSLAVGFSWAEQKANFTIASLFSQFVMIVALVFLIFLVYNLVKGGENKHRLLIVSGLYLVLYNIASMAAPTLFNAIGGTLSTILGILNVIFLITFIVGILGFISGLSVPQIKSAEGTTGAEIPGVAKTFWGATFGRKAKASEKAFKENQEILGALYGSISGDIRDGEDAKKRLADLSNQVLVKKEITNNVKNLISNHISELEIYFNEGYNSKVKNDEALLASLASNINEEVKRWSGRDINKTIEGIIRQVIPNESKNATKLAGRFVNAYKSSILSVLNGALLILNNNELVFKRIKTLVNLLLGKLAEAKVAINKKRQQDFALRIKDSISTINYINDDFVVVASSINEIKKKMTTEIATEQALREKVEEYLTRLGHQVQT